MLPDCPQREDVDGAEDCALNGRKVDDAEDAPVGGGAGLANAAHLDAGVDLNEGTALSDTGRGPRGPIGADIEEAAENTAALSGSAVRGVLPL